MEKDRIIQIIQDEVKNFTIKLVQDKNKPKQEVKKRPENEYEKAIREMDVDKHIFYGGENEDKIESAKQRYLKEQEEMDSNKVTITTSEIKDFETKFKDNVSDRTIFDKQQNGTSMYAYNGVSGIEAKCSGIIPLNSENKIKWEYSIQNGVFVEIKAELSTELVDILENLNSFYVSWDAEWTDKLSSN